ncbi:MAG: Serine/threonine-protein kinase PknB [Planctomycetes bacterium ADurb.Bin126]|nr:MAG: Serine/threonine-protein kinase PknB [Planctomycetes bacterium ADurb.Bin126]HOD82271.1 protein kinase [Phycisphaerae bacterium]HQL72916.1 protein kinase [Phycisphaerae bacterium]
MVANPSDRYRCGHPRLVEAHTLDLCPRCLLAGVIHQDHAPGDMGSAECPFAPDLRELNVQFSQLEFLELIGRGGMAAVYKARQGELRRLVAVKVFSSQGNRDPGLMERFLQEGRVLSGLSHPGIIPVFDFQIAGEYWCLVMELAEGSSLRRRLQDGPLLPLEALQIALEVCRALRYAHSRGVVHRDVKPDNILLSPPQQQAGAEDAALGRVRLADFGLVKLLADRGDRAATAVGLRLGTAHYMAPEQLENPGAVDQRADLYALGVVLYEMLTGELPIGRFPHPSRKARVGRRVDEIVLRCLEKSPQARYADAGALEEALESALAESLAAGPRRRIRRLAAAAVAISVAGATGGIGIWHLARDGTDPAAAVQHSAAHLLAPAPPSAAADIPPAFFLPYPGLSRPQVSMIRDGRAEFIREMSERYGAGRVAMFWVDGLPGDVGTYVHDEVMRIVGTDRCNGIGGQGSLNIVIAPVDDVAAAARKVAFGQVTSVDPKERTIRIQADPARLPPPLPPDVTDTAAPNFYKRNLEDLGCWDRHRRLRATVRLSDTPPVQLQEEIAAALEALLTDPSIKTREAAAEALGSWGGPGNLAALERAAASIPQSAREAIVRIRQRFPKK